MKLARLNEEVAQAGLNLARANSTPDVTAFSRYTLNRSSYEDNPVGIRNEMLVVASVGLLINLVGIFLLRAASKESLNMKGAYYEVFSDLLTSVGVIAAALIMLTTGWYYADPLISAGIGLFILPRTWMLLRDAVGVLLEGTSTDVNVAALREAIGNVAGVASVHDLHVWSLTVFPLWSGKNAVVHGEAETAPLSDHSLAIFAGAGDTAAFEQLYTRHNRRVYSLCLRMKQNVAEAEDLVQEAFIQLFRKIGSFRGESAFTTWLHRLTVNQVLMHFRKRSVRLERTTEEGDTPVQIVRGTGDGKL